MRTDSSQKCRSQKKVINLYYTYYLFEIVFLSIIFILLSFCLYFFYLSQQICKRVHFRVKDLMSAKLSIVRTVVPAPRFEGIQPLTMLAILFKIFVSPPIFSIPSPFKVFQTVLPYPHSDNSPLVLIRHTKLPYTYTQVHF